MNRTTRSRRLPLRLTAAVVLVSLLAAGGCRSLTYPRTTDSFPWVTLRPGEDQYFEPDKVVVIWSEAIYTQAGKPPTRGFGGRVYFYGRQHQRPIPVQGELTVYAYDDTHRMHHSDPPDRKFVFPAEQLAGHFSPTELGASYSIWIPWDPVGGEERHISLLPVFRTARGGIVQGKQAANILPGRKQQRFVPGATSEIQSAWKQALTSEPTQQAAFHQPLGHQPLGHHGAGSAGISPEKGLGISATTIPVPPALARQMTTSGHPASMESTGTGHPVVRYPSTEAAPPPALQPSAVPYSTPVPQSAVSPTAAEDSPQWHFHRPTMPARGSPPTSR